MSLGALAAALPVATAGALAAPAVVATAETVFSGPGFGRAVSTYADTTIAGGTGFVQVFERDASGWGPTATLGPSDLAGDSFGATVELSGGFALVGAPLASVGGQAEAGAAYVFQRDPDGTWVQRARLVAETPAAGAHFGAALDASAELWLVIGAPGAGQATIFEPVVPGVSWQVTGRLPGPGLPPEEAVAAGFGTAVAIEVAFGFELVVVGAPGAEGSGRVYTYLSPGTDWVGWWSFVDDPRVPGGRFGQSLAMESTTIVVGAPGVDAFVGLTFDLSTGTVTSLGRDLGGSGFGNALGVGSAQGIAGDPAVRAAYLYARGVGGGELRGVLLPSTGTPGDGFGTSVSVNRAAVVGAPGSGAIHVFDLGTTDVVDHVSLTVTGALSYVLDGDVLGRIAVTRSGGRVVAVSGRGRLAGWSTASPYVEFALLQLGVSGRVAGTITVRDPVNGFVHTLKVNTTARVTSATAVAGAGIGFDRPQPARRVDVRWAVDDLAP